MKTIRISIVIGLITCALSATIQGQSLWEKMKKAAQNAQSNSRSTQTASGRPAPNAAPVAASVHPPGPPGSPELTAQIAADAGFQEVTGIKLGMTVKEAMTALRAHNDLLIVAPQTYTNQLIPNQTLVSGVHATVPLVAGEIFENYDIAFTMPPGTAYVTAVGRTINYPRGRQPSLQTAIDGMREKYGHETFVPRMNPDDPAFIWVMDLKGNRIEGSEGQRVAESCTSAFRAEIQSNQANEIVGGGYEITKNTFGALDCGAYATTAVYFQSNKVQGQSDNLVSNMLVLISNGGLFCSAAQATHAQYLAVQKQQDDQQMTNAQKQKVSF